MPKFLQLISAQVCTSLLLFISCQSLPLTIQEGSRTQWELLDQNISFISINLSELPDGSFDGLWSAEFGAFFKQALIIGLEKFLHDGGGGMIFLDHSILLSADDIIQSELMRGIYGSLANAREIYPGLTLILPPELDCKVEKDFSQIRIADCEESQYFHSANTSLTNGEWITDFELSTSEGSVEASNSFTDLCSENCILQGFFTNEDFLPIPQLQAPMILAVAHNGLENILHNSTANSNVQRGFTISAIIHSDNGGLIATSRIILLALLRQNYPGLASETYRELVQVSRREGKIATSTAETLLENGIFIDSYPIPEEKLLELIAGYTNIP